MDTVKNKLDLARIINKLRLCGETIALVPTMGSLHEGHISLVKLAQQNAEAVVVSIFVNPIQFGPNEDFSRYPRTEAEDIQKLEGAGTTIAYLPSVEEMYPEGSKTIVHVKGISEELCGAFRPGHFEGVATVVTKLFMQVMPDVAIFGEKDYQQLHIIRQFTRDLDIPVRIIGAPIMREDDGLAMSSRNRYLSNDERKTAAMLYQILRETAQELRAGRGIETSLSQAKGALLSEGFDKIDYIELRDADNLYKIGDIKKPARLLAAAYLGKTRLIDNIPV